MAAMERLTSRERLMRLYRHESADRPAVFIRWGGMEEADASYDGLRRLVEQSTDRKVPWDAGLLREPRPVTSRTERFDDGYDLQTNVLATPKGDLVERVMVSRHGLPSYTREHFVKSVEDCERWLTLPNLGVGGSCASFFATDHAIGERGIVDVYLGSNPAGAVVELMGSETFAVMSVTERDLVHRMMARERDDLLALVLWLLDLGVGPCFSFAGQEYLTPPLHGRRDFFDFNVAYDQPITAAIRARGGRVHVHCHGSLARVLDGFPALGADVIHPFEAPPMGDVTPARAKEALGASVTLEGNIQIADMYGGATPDGIRSQVRELIRQAFGDRQGLIVCPTASPYRTGDGALCLENYRVMVAEVLAWRG
jgi:hypothetical protein